MGITPWVINLDRMKLKLTAKMRKPMLRCRLPVQTVSFRSLIKSQVWFPATWALGNSLRQMFTLMLLLIVAFGMTTAPALAQVGAESSGLSLKTLMQNALQWINSLGPIGGLVFIGVYIIATVALLPGSILTLGAGVLFGVVAGSCYVFVGATIGAVLAFWAGRYLVRGWVAKTIEGNTSFRAIDQAVGREGFKIVLLTRLSPVFPFNLLNYAMGLTSVSLRDYFFGSVGMIPGTIMYVYLGALAGDLARLGAGGQPTNAVVQWAIRIIGFIATVAVTVYVTRIARNALAESVLIEGASRLERSAETSEETRL